MKRGRPVRSQIRDNIVEILYHLGKGYGYQVSKIYNALFPQVTQRLVYYHLRKGVSTREVEVHKVEVEKGDFSWGNSVEKTYYTLGPAATPIGNKKVREVVKRWPK